MHEAVDGYYPKHSHAEIAELLGKSPNELGDEFMERVAVAMLTVESGLGPGSTKRDDRKALMLVAQRATALAEALEDLTGDAWRALADAAFEQFGPYQETSEFPTPPDQGYYDDRSKRVGAWILLLMQLASLAEEPLEKFKVGGRPAQPQLVAGVEILRDIWTEVTKRKPTLSSSSRTGETNGRFLQFCRLVLAPILGPSAKLEHAVRSALYGENRTRKRPRKNP